MRFRDFLLKTLLADTDYLVGYDADGHYVRISKADLAAQMSAGAIAPSITVQYSVNGESWHDAYVSGDHYLRLKVGSGAWNGPIPLCLSAFDIWRNAGNSGTEADFLESLRGEDGDTPDASSMRLQDIGGYTEFLQEVRTALANEKSAIIQEVATSAAASVMEQFTGLQLSDITEVRSLSDDDFITIVTRDGLRKVKVGNLSDNVAVRTVSTKGIEASVNTQLEILSITGEKDGSNIDYVVSKNYIAGTSNLFLNGQRLVANTDYKEVVGGFKMLTHTPVSSDSLVFFAVVK